MGFPQCEHENSFLLITTTFTYMSKVKSATCLSECQTRVKKSASVITNANAKPDPRFKGVGCHSFVNPSHWCSRLIVIHCLFTFLAVSKFKTESPRFDSNSCLSNNTLLNVVIYYNYGGMVIGFFCFLATEWKNMENNKRV